MAVDSRAKGPVTGRILVDGKPIQVEGVSLVLMPADQSAAVTIPVSKEGTFEGQAPLGKHYVSISAGHTPDAGHGEGPKVGFGPLFLSTESPLMITVAESATPQDLEVGNAAAKKNRNPIVADSAPLRLPEATNFLRMSRTTNSAAHKYEQWRSLLVCHSL